ncbi:DUF4251 domain-containing protein [Mucilaginibacter sp. X4EP1]|uniref:DUF4251 domain-containing protein n=1 Tax=Mucilaginibacter sp. X4EP1 TaxID=2723092 RepID=UPI0021685CE3|nr:DUF4251 domain-containing protein [Mucilaginibacter sp. X4EP1]MCS3813226.1 hypothetical protein [Mucilaginibacter sp. X4EP1]
MKTLVKLLLTPAIIFCVLSIAAAQTTKQQKQAAKEATIKKMVDSVHYVFKANYALPMRGGQKTLTSDYDFIVKKDTITAYLPYFGRAYTAPNDIYTNEGGIKFKTADFSYDNKPGKKGGWEITIKPKDSNISNWRSVQQMYLSISTNGYATLRVISSNRDPISFDGYIESIKSK